MQDIATLIRETRKRHGLGQRSLARRAGTSQAHIGRIERGEVSPSIETAVRLLEVMGERLSLSVEPGPRGNVSTAELQADYRRLTPGERVVQAAELSFALTSIAAGKRSR